MQRGVRRDRHVRHRVLVQRHRAIPQPQVLAQAVDVQRDRGVAVDRVEHAAQVGQALRGVDLGDQSHAARRQGQAHLALADRHVGVAHVLRDRRAGQDDRGQVLADHRVEVGLGLPGALIGDAHEHRAPRLRDRAEPTLRLRPRPRAVRVHRRRGEIDGDRVLPGHGRTGLFIHPGHQFRVVQGLITNFHLPKSSLLMLVSAFAGREPVLAAYQDAVREGYRFYSYGDAMVIL